MSKKNRPVEIPFVEEGEIVEVPHKVTGVQTRYEVVGVNGVFAKLIKVDTDNKRKKGRPVQAIMTQRVEAA